MKSYFIPMILFLSSIIVSGQQLKLAQASPFTAVRWELEQPIVQFENEWYHFEKLDGFSKKEILDICKSKFGRKWQDRFSEDLVEVLQHLGYTPNVQVRLELSKDGVVKTYTGTFTETNREKTLQFNHIREEAEAKRVIPQEISIAAALEDIRQFEELLKTTSSYAQLSSFDFATALKKVAARHTETSKDIHVNTLTHELSMIMSQLGDRHSSIKNEAFKTEESTTYTLRLPFGVTTLDGKIIGVQKSARERTHSYYHTIYPYLKSIDGIAIETLINRYNYKDSKAPIQTKLSRGSQAIQNYGALLFKNNIPCPENVEVVFTNGTTEITEIVPLTIDRKGYISKVAKTQYDTGVKIKNGNFEDLHQVLAHTIGYISIPQMFHYEEIEGLEVYIENIFKEFKDTKSLIIDIRNNPGGSRELLQTFAKYIVQPEQSPWIANVAYLRTDAKLNGDVASMSNRYLYSYDSEKLTNVDRNAIDVFDRYFKLQKTIDTSAFSTPYYMILHNGEEIYTKPVYILVNENSFSAATVFTSAFKGLPNVKIVGETTDGSSGNAKITHLQHSNIRVKISTMLSFQRNGKTLDGNGTLPDIRISPNETQVLEGYDHQLNTLIAQINKNK